MTPMRAWTSPRRRAPRADDDLAVRRPIWRRGLLLWPLWLLLMAVVPRVAMAQPTAEAAEALVSEVGAKVLAILQDPAASNQDKFDRLVAVLEGPIDLDLVAKLILGRHWRSASKEQQTQYLELFRAYALEFLASKLHLYSGQEFQVVGAKTVSERDAVVTTRILSNGGPPVEVDWRLREAPDGSLMAIDVVVAGVSLIVSQRSEFSSVIERQGFDGLLDQMRSQVKRQL